MKTSHTVRAAAIALLLLLPVLHGCQGKEISVAIRAHKATVDYLHAEYQAGRISPETQVNVIAPAVEATSAILHEWVDAYVKGTPFDWRGALTRFDLAMGPLLRQQEVLKGSNDGTPVPTTN